MNIFTRLKTTIFRPQKTELAIPQARRVLHQLNLLFRLGLDIVPGRKQRMIMQLAAAFQNHPSLLNQINHGIEKRNLESVNKSLSVAGMGIIKVGENKRIRFIEKRSVAKRAIDRIVDVFEPAPLLVQGEKMSLVSEVGLINIFYSKGMGRGQRVSITAEEYADNGLMKRAIGKGRGQFLKDNTKGFTTGNINVDKFSNAGFRFRNKAGEAKGFVGRTLLRNRSKGTNIASIIALLKEIGIEVIGELEKKKRLPRPTAEKRLPRPTAEEYRDRELVRTAILGRREEILRDPSKGFVVGNIKVEDFISASFEFVNKRGEEKRFTAENLLRRVGIASNIKGIVIFLREIGIEVGA